MTTLREAAQQALEFIRWSQYVPCQSEAFLEPPSTAPQVEAALRAALAEPVQHPVAWRTFDGEGGYDYRSYEDNEDYREEYVKRNGEKYSSWVEPLYTAPPQRKPLTDEEIYGMYSEPSSDAEMVEFARAVERAHGIGEKK